MKQIKTSATLFIAIVISIAGFAQNKKPRVSLPDTATGMIGNANITIAYSSPSVKNRKIWGALVKYDSVWRAGANEATTFETDKDIKVQGKLLPAGKYSFFIIPKRDKAWIAIFNKVANQWGAFKYDATQDQLRVNVKPEAAMQSHPQEMLKYHIGEKGFSLNWENVSVPVLIKARK